jgi:hypothetical protein
MLLRTRFTHLAARLFVAAGLLFGLVATPATALGGEPKRVQAGASAACEDLLAGAKGSPQAALLADCSCQAYGCVRTQGYWGNKPGVVWPKGFDRNAPFFASGLSWQQVLDSPVRGDAYFILAHQYIAAALNIGTDASAPNSLQVTLWYAGKWLETAELGKCIKGACQVQRSWAGLLDEYNNGQYPGGPAHCDDKD